MSLRSTSCDSSFSESMDEHNLQVLRTAFNTVALMRDRENLQDVGDLADHLATLMGSLRLRCAHSVEVTVGWRWAATDALFRVDDAAFAELTELIITRDYARFDVLPLSRRISFAIGAFFLRIYIHTCT